LEKLLRFVSVKP